MIIAILALGLSGLQADHFAAYTNGPVSNAGNV